MSGIFAVLAATPVMVWVAVSLSRIADALEGKVADDRVGEMEAEIEALKEANSALRDAQWRTAS
jgi:hypothetical protein